MGGAKAARLAFVVLHLALLQTPTEVMESNRKLTV